MARVRAGPAISRPTVDERVEAIYGTLGVNNRGRLGEAQVDDTEHGDRQ